jgi:predicted NAD/FAD-binding protein
MARPLRPVARAAGRCVATAAERRLLLRAIGYQSNRAVLHTDTGLLPRNRRVWSAWNYMAGEGAPDQRAVSVTYLMNRLQPLPFRQPVMVSLNPFIDPDAGRRVISAHRIRASACSTDRRSTAQLRIFLKYRAVTAYGSAAHGPAMASMKTA